MLHRSILIQFLCLMRNMSSRRVDFDAELKAATVEEPPPKKRSPFAALSENEDGDRKEIEKLAKMSDDF